MKRKGFFIIIVIMLLLNGITPVWGADVSLKGEPEPLGSLSEVLRDPSREITIDQLLDRKHDEAFREHEANVFQFGLTKDAHWIRTSLKELPEEKMPDPWNEYLLYYDYSGIERIEIYLPIIDQEEEGYIPYKGGFYNSKMQDETGFIFPVFQLPENLDPERPIYSRVESTYSKNFTMAMVERNHFSGVQLRMVAMLSSMYGIMLAMLLYNLVLFFALKDRTYIFYVGYIMFMIIYQTSVTGFLKIIHFQWAQILELYALATTFIAVIFGLLFAWHFINYPRFVPKAKYPALLCMAICGIGILLVLSGNQYYANGLAYLMGFTLPFLIFSTAIIAYRKGQTISKYYLMATAVLFSTIIIFALRGAGILEHSFVTLYAVTASVALESILLSFALADRIRMFRKRQEQSDERVSELTHISITDSLTRLFNRRYFEEVLSEIRENPNKSKTPVTMIYLDIDHFKKFNDTYGHPKGDQVLKKLAEVIRENIREGDHPCRIGGEEFAVIFHHTNGPTAWQIAERIRSSLEAVDFSSIAPQIPTVTVSIGVAELKGGEAIEDWVNRTDKMLYTAKEQGRNRISQVDSSFAT
ncbi:sensor domain-containing diguanylate cyclase [Isachenkonia alkalipeptolytica]|uniref:GGDEF domain-containing protein n=1 Tax=Isachenkonia alkalipeptolytica TaxID=2565777 RepID=A0AA44BEY0_9CLOT|nr:diguanylate cyclase [Isachenkonia alkalipeptolytica]NBG89428.1 GGDEF domain-containing protein [Isachenkonia alkalipeptolytica]